jgi:hypothetical protein
MSARRLAGQFAITPEVMAARTVDRSRQLISFGLLLTKTA